jgi:hypothetical protein
MSSPWQKSVAVTLESVDPLQYTIVPTGSDPLPTQNGLLVFDNNNHNGFNINFTFTDKTNGGYLWPPNNLKGQAVWSKVGTAIACPASPDTDVFHAVSVNKTCTVLKVNNPNPSPAQGAFQYTLCVTNDGGATYLPLDPGGINNNGSTRYFSATLVVAAVVGAVVGATATLVTTPAARPVNIAAFAIGGAILAVILYFAFRGSRERVA